MASIVTFEQIVAAAHRLKGHIRLTPCQKSVRLQKLLGAEVYLKQENMQFTGAFKGNLNFILNQLILSK